MALFKGWKELALIVLLAAVSATIVRHFFLTPFRVPSGSMQPALKPGDFIFVSQVAYGVGVSKAEKWAVLQPERGDIVTFYYSAQEKTAYVKRVIGLPGDRIEMKSNHLIINGTPLSYTMLNDKTDLPNPEFFELFEEKFGSTSWRVILKKPENIKTSKSFQALVVPPGEVFLLGDNRDVSDDSRDWGTVPTQQIFGRVSLIWLSVDRQQLWAGDRFPSMRWERILTRVH